MGRIIKLQQSESGVIREAEIRLSNQKIIRRPVNLLIPLEIGEQQSPDTEGNATNTPNEGSKEGEQNSTHHYNLRPRTRSETMAIANKIEHVSPPTGNQKS